jgi:cytochrome c553
MMLMVLSGGIISIVLFILWGVCQKMIRLMSKLLLLLVLMPVVAVANPYLQKCAMCHGADGISKMPGVPNLADTKLSAEQITGIIENGRGKMPKISIDDVQKSDVVQYIVKNIRK